MTSAKRPDPVAADDAVIAALGVMTRGSEAMYARRRRILREARTMLGEQGGDFGMRELARRADVSLRTLYNAFGGKEALIATAIRQYYDKFLAAICQDSDLTDFDWVLSAVVVTNLRNRQIPHYLSALIGLYFSTSVDRAIRDELRRVAAGYMRPWLQACRARRYLRPGVDIDRVLGDVAGLQYALNQEWLLGHLPDDRFLPTVQETVLSYLSGVTSASARREIDAALIDLRGEASHSSRRTRIEGERLESLLGISSPTRPAPPKRRPD